MRPSTQGGAAAFGLLLALGFHTPPPWGFRGGGHLVKPSRGHSIRASVLRLEDAQRQWTLAEMVLNTSPVGLQRRMALVPGLPNCPQSQRCGGHRQGGIENGLDPPQRQDRSCTPKPVLSAGASEVEYEKPPKTVLSRNSAQVAVAPARPVLSPKEAETAVAPARSVLSPKGAEDESPGHRRKTQQAAFADALGCRLPIPFKA